MNPIVEVNVQSEIGKLNGVIIQTNFGSFIQTDEDL